MNIRSSIVCRQSVAKIRINIAILIDQWHHTKQYRNYSFNQRESRMQATAEEHSD